MQLEFSKIELIVFDMDGTMLDTEALSIKAWQVAMQIQKLEVSQEQFIALLKDMTGTTFENGRMAMAKHLPACDYDRGYKDAVAYIDNHFKTQGVPTKPGLFELLDKIEAAGIKKCVATSTAKERATHKLTLVNIAHRFEVIVGGDEVAVSKPAPDIFLKAAELCGVAPENCLVLEDSAAGVKAGYRAGMQVIAIPDILQPSEETRAMTKLVCKDLHEVALLF